MHPTWIRKQLVAGILITLFFAIGPSMFLTGPRDTFAAEAGAASTATDAPAATGKASDWERLIYLPYKDLKGVFEKQGAAVFMPYQEALELWRRASQPKDASAEPPVEAVVTSSTYAARVDQDVVRVRASFVVRVLDAGWAEVPIRFGNAAVGGIHSQEEMVLLRGTGNGTYSLLLPRKGDFKVDLDLTVQTTTSPDAKSFEFDCPSVGVTALEVVVPEADQTIQFVPQGVTLPATSDKNETRVRANLGATNKIVCRWHPRVSDRPDMELLAAVTNHSIVSVQDGLIHAQARLTYDVLRGKMQSARVVLPVGHRILGVTSPNAKIRSWKASAESKRQVVTVEFLGAVEGQAIVEVHSERSSEQAAFDVAGIADDGTVHGIHAIDVVRENGQLVITHAADLALAVEQQLGVIRIDAAEVADAIKQPNSLAYKFYSPQFQLRIAARPVEPRIQVDHQSRLVFSDDELRLKADLNYTVERAGVFALNLLVPDGLTIDHVSTKGLKEFNVDEKTKTLTVSLTAKKQGTIAVTILGHRPLDDSKPESEQILPILEPQSVERETGYVTVYAPESLDLISDEEKIVAAQPAPPKRVERMPNVRLAASWSYSRRPMTIPVKTIRRPTRLSATVATVVTAKPELVEVVTHLDYLVEYAGVDTFRFSVPEAIADDVQIRSAAAPNAPAIKQKARDEKAVDGWVTWTVTMQRDVVGHQRLDVSYDLKPAAVAAAVDANQAATKKDVATGAEQKEATPSADATHQYVVQAIQALGLPANAKRTGEVVLTQTNGEIAVLKDRALSVTASPVDDAFEGMDVRELTLLPQNGSLAYRYFKQPVSLKVVSTRHEIQKVVDTVVSRALVEIVLGQDKLATYRCRFRLKSSERQRLRLDLPAGVDLLGLTVDRRQVSPEKAADSTEEQWEPFLVNVARTKSSDELFWITVQFQMGLSAAFEAASGPLNLPLPRVAGVNGSRVASQETRVVLWVPDEFALVGTPDEFVHTTRASGLFGTIATRYVNQDQLEGWIGGETAGVFDFPTAGHAYQYRNLGGADRLELIWWNIPTHTWLLSGAFILIALVLRRTSWENKLGLLLLGAFAAALYGLQDSDLVAQGVSAARYGLAAMVALWLIHGILGAKPSVKMRPAEPESTPGTSAEQAAKDSEAPSVPSDDVKDESTGADDHAAIRSDDAPPSGAGDSSDSDASSTDRTED